MQNSMKITLSRVWCYATLFGLLAIGFFYFHITYAEETTVYINDTENPIAPYDSVGLRANYPIFTIEDRFSIPLTEVSELRVPIAKFNPGANGCAYSKFSVYEDGVEIYSTEDNFTINYLYFEPRWYNYTNDTEQWSSFRIEPPLDFNTTSKYEFKIESGNFYCYFSFVEQGTGLPRLWIRGLTINGYVTRPLRDYNVLYSLLGNANAAPIFDLNDQTVDEGALLSFNATATDPEGDNIVYEAIDLPANASFDTVTGLFSWTPGYDQAGSYDVTFIATDDGEPIKSTEQTINILVIDIPTPTEQAEDLIEDVTALELPLNVENSYLANLQKVEAFIVEEQIIAAINQLNAFVNKVEQDYQQGKITEEEYTSLLAAANKLIDELTD